MSTLDTVTTHPGVSRSERDGSWLSARLEMLPGPRWPIAVLSVAGELDIATQLFAENVLRAAVDDAPGPVVVDLAGLRFSSIHGLELLTAPACTEGGHEYVVAGLTPHLQRLAARLCTPDRPVRFPDATSAVTALRANQTPPPAGAAARIDDRSPQSAQAGVVPAEIEDEMRRLGGPEPDSAAA